MWWLSGGGCCAEGQAGKGCETIPRTKGAGQPGKQVKSNFTLSTVLMSYLCILCSVFIPFIYTLIHSCYISIFTYAIYISEAVDANTAFPLITTYVTFFVLLCVFSLLLVFL